MGFPLHLERYIGLGLFDLLAIFCKHNAVKNIDVFFFASLSLRRFRFPLPLIP